MFSRIQRFTCTTLRGGLLLICIWLAVGPLAILQLGAWSWMLATYSQESSLEQAIRETFGNERPCSMCQVIDAVEREQPDENEGKASFKTGDFKLITHAAAELIFPRVGQRKSARIPAASKGPVAPAEVPTPPPRMQLV